MGLLVAEFIQPGAQGLAKSLSYMHSSKGSKPMFFC